MKWQAVWWWWGRKVKMRLQASTIQTCTLGNYRQLGLLQPTSLLEKPSIDLNYNIDLNYKINKRTHTHHQSSIL